ncbi:MAG TPA: hypothetical protein PK765_04830 [bacterium]|nr:hypothetical protein [bacterium]
MSTKSSRSVPGLDSLPLDPRIAIENFAESVAPRSFVGSFTRAASTGEVSVSGIGFRPRAVIMLSRFLSVMDHAHSIGFA